MERKAAAKGIDHLVLSVHDLEDARARYGAMGFTLTPEARHPFGTGNSLVQLDGCFLEIVIIADPALIPPMTEERFSFAEFNRGFLDDGEGFSMLVLDSEDARADQARYTEAGLHTYEPFDFQRKARLPSGEDVTVGFSIAFVTHPDMARAAFFTCQQHAPEHFWKPEYQTHRNGAKTIGDVYMVAQEPDRYADLIGAYSGATPRRTAAGEISAQTSRGSIQLLSPDAWKRHFPAAFAPDLGHGPRFAGYSIVVDDVDVAAQCLREGRITKLRDGDRIVVAPGDAFGSMIVFREAT